MDGRPSVLRLGFPVAEERYHLLYVRDLPDCFLRVDVSCFSLCFANCAEGSDLAVVETGVLAEVGEAYGFGVDAVEFGEGTDCVVPPEYNSLDD